ncbi:MAG: glycyl-radical enzyme activating protein [bacterium]
MVQPTLTGTLFDIQGFSVHDGPGCRTLIFLKGCPLSCKWCCNPEGRHAFIEPLFRRNKCTFDKLCVEACPRGAISAEEHSIVINRAVCATCETYVCAEACCTGALQKGGTTLTVEKLFSIIQRDRQYWGNRGGITLTGGEPFFQWEFSHAILKRCHDSLINTAAETCGQVPWEFYEPSLVYLDWLFFDIKHLDPENHRDGTGQPNRLILENAQRLAHEFPGRMVFRMAVIPGYNDSGEHIRELAGFLVSTGRKEINILPLHHLGREKYTLAGLPYYTDDFTLPTVESLQHIAGIFGETGIACYVGSETPF